ncbi:hypothetical protein, partial [uncultured Flavobacterium sp.]|uniref:hypothetical protein n=1 Tax=uncultured Flavobacterium sp. TaxID=165435 RepID=UPI0030C7FCDA
MKSKLPITHYLLSITFFLLPITLFSQSYQWLQSGGGNNNTTGNHYSSKEQVVDMATDSQRNIYLLSTVTKDNVLVNSSSPIAVTTYNVDPNHTDFILISYTCNGSYRWHKVFGGGGDDILSGIIIDNQDNVYVSGIISQCVENNGSYPWYSMPRIGDSSGIDYTFSNTSTSCQRIFLSKFNSNGVFQWIHFPHSPLNSSSTTAISLRNFYIVNDVIHWIVQLPPGSYENGAFSNTNTSLPFLYYVLKYDTSGTFINATAFDLQVTSYISSEVRWYRNPYNGYFYAIHTYNSNSNNTITAGGNTLSNTFSKIICFNDQGQYQWHRESTGSSMGISSVDFDAQNNVYIAGITNNYNFTGEVNSFLGWTLPGTNTGIAAFVMKCNPDVSSYSWLSYYNPANNFLDGNILYTATKIYLSGSFNGVSLTWGTQSVVGPGSNNGRDAILVSLDPATGTCTSLNRIVGNNGFDDGFTKMTLDNNGD